MFTPQVSGVASHLTPVPGGVGPMTVAMLMYNTVQVNTLLQYHQSPRAMCLLPCHLITWCLVTCPPATPSPGPQGALRAHQEAVAGEWKLSLLPLHPLEKVPSDIEVYSSTLTRTKPLNTDWTNSPVIAPTLSGANCNPCPGGPGTDSQGYLSAGSGDWTHSLRGGHPNHLLGISRFSLKPSPESL